MVQPRPSRPADLPKTTSATGALSTSTAAATGAADGAAKTVEANPNRTVVVYTMNFILKKVG